MLLFAAGSFAADNGPSTDKLGRKIDNVGFKDAAGKTVTLHELKGGKATVIVFVSFECPVSTSYTPTLLELHKQYADKGVSFVALCPCDEDAAAVARQAKEFRIPFPVFRDNKFAAADAFKADVTPEAFLVDGQFQLRYRGRIDNSYYARLKKNSQTTRQDLKQALDELLAGKDITEPATRPIGCTIARETVARAANGPVTYHRDVQPILQKHCQSCHRPGAVGPFSLLTYNQAVNWANDIKEYTQSRQMPPWKPVEGLSFRDERKLRDTELATLAAWVDGGSPKGDPKDAPPPLNFTDSWQLGKPDLVLTVAEEFQLGASGRDLFRCFVLPTGLTEDKFVTAFEVRPGNPRVVHHTLNFIDTQGRGRKMEQAEKDRPKKENEKDFGPGYSQQMGVGFLPNGGLGGWAPGQVARHLPADTAYFLPKESDVVVQVHYHRDGRDEKDRLQIGLYFAEKPASRRFQSFVIPGRFFFIPAGVEDYKIQGSAWVDKDCTVHSVMPHMHMLGKSIKVTMTPPEGPPQVLVNIKEWDYNWQETYFFKESLQVKSGSRFDIEAHYNNTASNPRNPNHPPAPVRFGEQTTDEMCFGFLGVTTDDGSRVRPKFEKPK